MTNSTWPKFSLLQTDKQMMYIYLTLLIMWNSKHHVKSSQQNPFGENPNSGTYELH